jgi:hypothetical protein
MFLHLFAAGWLFLFSLLSLQEQDPTRTFFAKHSLAIDLPAADTIRTWLVINPAECSSCTAVARTYDFKRLGSTWAVVLPTRARRESATLLPALFGPRAAQVSVVFSDSLYQRHCPDNVSRVVVEHNQQPVFRVALKALGQPWAIMRLNAATPVPLPFHAQVLTSPTKQPWSEQVTLQRATDRLFILDPATNTVGEYSLDAATSPSPVKRPLTGAGARPMYTWHPSQLTYAQWYRQYFGDTTGLRTSSKLLPRLEKIGRHQPMVQTLTAQDGRGAATVLVFWFLARPESNGQVGVYSRALLVELRDGRMQSAMPVNTPAADSAGFGPAVDYYVWHNDSTLLSTVSPPVALLASRQVPVRPVVAEFVRRRGRLAWGHSLPTIKRPTIYQRDQRLIGDYMILVPSFCYAYPYVFFQDANDIQDISGAGSFTLPFFSDARNDLNLRRNNNESRISYQVKAVTRTKSGNYIAIVQQDKAMHALVLDEYLALLADATLPAQASTAKTWVISPAGVASGFVPEEGKLVNYQIL